MTLFSILYYILALFLYLIFLPFLFFKSKKLKYKEAIPARFFLKNNKKFKHHSIWFHSCSMGETKALKVIIDKLKQEVNLSVVTNTGYEEAKKITSNSRYLPYEIFLPFWITKQKALVVMEAELWYMLFLCAKSKDMKTFLINARISDKSYKSYKRFSWFYKKIFSNIDKIFAQSKIDKERLEELGASNIEVIGNIKLAQLPKISKEYEKPKTFVLTAASTHEKEEELILQSYNQELGKLIFVPRHPERFAKVDCILKEFSKKNKLTYHKFSQKQNFDSDIVLVDKMGELVNIFAISDAVILGGSFENIGGHNPVEVAYFGCTLISGEHIFNQKALFEAINDFYIVKSGDLKETLDNVKRLNKSSLQQIGDISAILKELHEL